MCQVLMCPFNVNKQPKSVYSLKSNYNEATKNIIPLRCKRFSADPNPSEMFEEIRIRLLGEGRHL